MVKTIGTYNYNNIVPDGRLLRNTCAMSDLLTCADFSRCVARCLDFPSCVDYVDRSDRVEVLLSLCGLF